MNSEACVKANPDISGIGVRTAIYAQTLASLIPAFAALRDGKVENYELESVSNLSSTILVTAFTVLISAVIQNARGELSPFHLIVILNLSWLNNTNTFIHFALYLHSWIDMHRKDGEDDIAQTLNPILLAERALQHLRKESVSWSRLWNALSLHTLFILGSLHLTLMSILGLYVWTRPYGLWMPECTSVPFLSIFGYTVGFNSPALTVFSIVIYAVVVTPVINLLFPVVQLLLVHALCRAIGGKTVHLNVPTILALVVFLVITVNLVIVNELTLLNNEKLGIIEIGEAEWGFGQILAILLLVLPLREILQAISVISKRRHAEQREKATDDLKTLIKGHCFNHELDDLWNTVRGLLSQGANVNTSVNESEYTTILQLAAQYGRVDELNMLNAAGAQDVYEQPRKWATALTVAAATGSSATITTLIRQYRQANIGREYDYFGTALTTAVENNNLQAVETLLEESESRPYLGQHIVPSLRLAASKHYGEIARKIISVRKRSARYLSTLGNLYSWWREVFCAVADSDDLETAKLLCDSNVLYGHARLAWLFTTTNDTESELFSRQRRQLRENLHILPTILKVLPAAASRGNERMIDSLWVIYRGLSEENYRSRMPSDIFSRTLEEAYKAQSVDVMDYLMDTVQVDLEPGETKATIFDSVASRNPDETDF